MVERYLVGSAWRTDDQKVCSLVKLFVVKMKKKRRGSALGRLLYQVKLGSHGWSSKKLHGYPQRRDTKFVAGVVDGAFRVSTEQ